MGLGDGGGIILFVSLILLILALYLFTHVSRTLLFRSAFVLTRPLGAVVGDFLDKPINFWWFGLKPFHRFRSDIDGDIRVHLFESQSEC